MQVQRRQRVGRVVEPEIRWPAHQSAPLAHPAPEDRASVTLQAPYARVAAVVREELGQHLGAGADAKKLGMRAQLRPVVRGRCRRRAQLELRIAEGRQQRLKRLGVVVLDARRLIQHDARIAGCVELVQPVIVRDDDVLPLGLFGFSAVGHLHAKMGRLFDRLRGHRQRRQDQHWLSRVLAHCIGPCNLHPALAEASVGKDRGAATAQCPGRQGGLMREQARRHAEAFAYAGGRHSRELAADVRRVLV